MSWIVPTALILLVAFAASFVLCEWLVRSRVRRGGDDSPAA